MKDRKCCNCLKLLPLTKEFFWKDKYDKYNFQWVCKICQKERNKNYYNKNKEQLYKKSKLYLQKRIDEGNPVKKSKKSKELLVQLNNINRQTKKRRIQDLLNSVKSRCKKKNLKNELNYEFIDNLWTKQEGKCLLTGILFDLSVGIHKTNIKFNPLSPSIDKINPFGDYTKNNIRLVCTGINLGMGQFGQQNFDFLIKNYLKTTKNIKIDI